MVGRRFIILALLCLLTPACSAQPVIDAFLYNSKIPSWLIAYPYPKAVERRELPPVLFFEGHDVSDGTYSLAYKIMSRRKVLYEGELAVTSADGLFRAEAKLKTPFTNADAVSWRLSKVGTAAIAGQSPLRWSRFHGRVTYIDPQIRQSTYLKMTPIFFGAPGEFLIPVNEDGSFDELVPARIYTAINVDSAGYSYNSMERWAWDYDLRSDREDQFVIGRTEIYGMRAFNIPTTKLRTIFVLFRPTSLTRVMHFDVNGDGLVTGEERQLAMEAVRQTPTTLAPELRAENVKAWVNGKSVPVMRLDRVPEYDGNGFWQSEYVIQLSPPVDVRMRPFNEIKIEVQSTEQLRGKAIVDFGQGSVGFRFAQ